MSEHGSRRAELLARVQQERQQIARDLVPLAGAIGLVDRGWAGVRWFRQRPLLIALAVAAGTAFSFVRRRRGGPINLIQLGLSAWQSWRWVSRALAARAQSKP